MPSYILGHSTAELRRLTVQAEFLRPITERMLRAAGLRPGMRVLDIGCGAGDVSLLAAELVGATGSVLGFDRNAEAVEFARQRATEAGVRNVEFWHGVETDLNVDLSADCAIGRYVVPYQADPVQFIRTVARCVCPGGFLAFHEFDAARTTSDMAPVGTFDRIWGEMIGALKRHAASPDVARRLAGCFTEAGLTVSGGFCERPVGLPGTEPFFRWVAGSWVAACSVRDVEREEEEVDRLTAELEAAVASSAAQVVGDDQWCVWARTPSRDISSA